jgi:hypothetical protein
VTHGSRRSAREAPRLWRHPAYRAVTTVQLRAPFTGRWRSAYAAHGDTSMAGRALIPQRRAVARSYRGPPRDWPPAGLAATESAGTRAFHKSIRTRDLVSPGNPLMSHKFPIVSAVTATMIPGDLSGSSARSTTIQAQRLQRLANLGLGLGVCAMIMIAMITHTPSGAAAGRATPPARATAAVAAHTTSATAGERTAPPVKIAVVAAAPDRTSENVSGHTPSGKACGSEFALPPQYMG